MNHVESNSTRNCGIFEHYWSGFNAAASQAGIKYHQMLRSNKETCYPLVNIQKAIENGDL
jgi:hypothetical protein